VIATAATSACLRYRNSNTVLELSRRNITGTEVTAVTWAAVDFPAARVRVSFLSEIWISGKRASVPKVSLSSLFPFPPVTARHPPSCPSPPRLQLDAADKLSALPHPCASLRPHICPSAEGRPLGDGSPPMLLPLL
jgi:hypothetical protein